MKDSSILLHTYINRDLLLLFHLLGKESNGRRLLRITESRRFVFVLKVRRLRKVVPSQYHETGCKVGNKFGSDPHSVQHAAFYKRTVHS
jgi:hypothetical protein